MGINRKILVQSKSPINTVLRRSQRKNKYLRRYKSDNWVITNTTSILDLPNEILLHIFSLLPQEIILFQISTVCKRWNQLSKDLKFWKKVNLNHTVPMGAIKRWISMAPQLRHLVVTNRSDLSSILKLVSKNCKQLETLEVYNCRGSQSSLMVHSLPMCNMITRCCRLHDIHFHRTTFKSCKFFKILPRNRLVGKPCSYVGPITSKQLNAFLESIKENEMENSVILGNDQKMYTLDQLKQMLGNSTQAQRTDIGQAILNVL